MLRKALLVLLTLALALLFGCSKETPDEPTEPADPAACLVVADDAAQIYFATGNDYYVLYPGYSSVGTPEFALLSREPIDLDTVTVTVPIEAHYEVYFGEFYLGKSLCTLEITEEDGLRTVETTSYPQNYLPLYIYQTYAGLDWDNVGALRDAYAESGNSNELYIPYANALTEFAEEYTQLTVDDLPTFYRYTVYIFIDQYVVDESFQSIQVTIGDTTYDVPIGQVDIRLAPEYDTDEAYNYFYPVSSDPSWIDSYPYGEGIDKCASGVCYAAQAVTLTGLSFLENELSTVDILDVTVLIADAWTKIDTHYFEGDVIAIPWDGESPIVVQKGKYVGLIITFRDERLKQINYHSKLYPVLEFTHGDDTYACSDGIALIRSYRTDGTDTWLLYAMGMDGLDMESYFNNYYYKKGDTWRTDTDWTLWGQ